MDQGLPRFVQMLIHKSTNIIDRVYRFNNDICRWDITMPIIMEQSISILFDAGIGMAMFSLCFHIVV